MNKVFNLQSLNHKWSYPLTVKHDITQWMRNKCWVWHCQNGIYFVKISKRGIPSHGYCWSCYVDRIFQDIVYGNLSTNETWYSCDKHYKTKKIYLKLSKEKQSIIKDFLRIYAIRPKRLKR